MIILHVTSPEIHGSQVTEVQRLLNGANVFHRDWLLTSVDGRFGPLTGAAAKHAKWDLGYPARACDPTVGNLLVSFLNGRKQLTPSMKLLRIQRRRQELNDAWRNHLIAIAKHEIGTKEEPPGSNSGPRVSQYQAVTGAYHLPWCASFQCWLLRTNGYRGALPPEPAFVPSWVETARAGRLGYRVVSSRNAEPGDQVAFNFGQNALGQHLGLVTSRVMGSTFTTIEGNTGSLSRDNGGEVLAASRSLNEVVNFIRLVR